MSNEGSKDEVKKDEGFKFEEGREKALRFVNQGNLNAVEAVFRQVERREGREASQELAREIIKDYGKRQVIFE